jgi:hypothetical protein
MAALVVVFVIAQGAWALALRGKTATVVEGADPQSQLTYIGEHLSLLKTPFSLRLLMLRPNGGHAATT